MESIQENNCLPQKRSIEGEPSLPEGRPAKIQALDPDVVKKIAAGEIIVAPMHALKELIENSVDAGSTSIDILVKDGGLKLLQLTDNGHGIDREDLAILCERHTTSKIKVFEDLSSIQTYGFRGEALASISQIAHLSVTSKTASSSCAWRANYSNGKLAPAKPGQSADPKPTAGRGGTQISVEDLFYNVPTRRRAFRSASEEYAKILDVVGRYAVHCSKVAFSCKKHGDSGVSISTSVNSSTDARIRQIYGAAVANELVEYSLHGHNLGFTATGYASNANYQAKRTTILLFINHRSVESTAIRRAVDQTYSTFLPKGGHPFVYLNLEIEPQRVDVNIHPTKREVNFLNEEEIIEAICSEIRDQLSAVDSSRTYLTQTLLPGVRPPPTELQQQPQSSASNVASSSRVPLSRRSHESNLVRTDANARKITSMFGFTSARSMADMEDDGENIDDMDGLHYERTGRKPTPIRLTSVKNLRAMVRSSMHSHLTDIFSSSTYVGLVDEYRRIAVIQSGVKLFLVDYGMLAYEYFYQVGLTNFANFGTIELDSKPQIMELLVLAASSELQEHERRVKEGQEEANGADGLGWNVDVKTIAANVASQLIARRELLKEYFSLVISEEGNLLAIPLLLKGYVPSLLRLPRFLLRLGPFVDWNNEERCFHSFLRELAAFYTPDKLPLPPLPVKTTVPVNDENAQEGSTAEKTIPVKEDQRITRRRSQLTTMLEYVLFPAIKSRLVATNEMTAGIVETADLKGLYRVFERC